MKWINSTAAAGGTDFTVWNYVEGEDNKQLGSIFVDTDLSIRWQTRNSHGKAKSVGQAKRAVQKLAAKN